MRDNRLHIELDSPLRLGTFTPSVLLDVARTSGALVAAGVAVEEIAVASSPAQFESLESGELDAVFTSPDNVIAYGLLARNPLARRIDTEIVRGLDRGLGLALALRPGLSAISGGLRLGVDVPHSGFAFVAYALLARAGVSRTDVEIVTMGSTPRRAQALLAGTCDLTILGSGNELVAARDGATIADEATSLGPYLGTVLARLRERGDDPRVERLSRALDTTARAITAGRLTREAEVAAARALGLPPELAARHVEVMMDDRTGLIPDGRVTREQLALLVELRAAALPDPQLATIDPADVAHASILAP